MGLPDSGSDSDGVENTSMNGPNTMSRREVENELYGGTDDSRKTSIMMASHSHTQLVQARERAAERAKTANRRKLKGAVKGVIAAQGFFGAAGGGNSGGVDQLAEHENPLHRGNAKDATVAERLAAGRTLSTSALSLSPAAQDQPSGHSHPHADARI